MNVVLQEGQDIIRIDFWHDLEFKGVFICLRNNYFYNLFHFNLGGKGGILY